MPHLYFLRRRNSAFLCAGASLTRPARRRRRRQIFTGSPEGKAFCAGMDLNGMPGGGVMLELGHIVALHYRSPTLYHIR
jgi:hypothetical protein